MNIIIALATVLY